MAESFDLPRRARALAEQLGERETDKWPEWYIARVTLWIAEFGESCYAEGRAEPAVPALSEQAPVPTLGEHMPIPDAKSVLAWYVKNSCVAFAVNMRGVVHFRTSDADPWLVLDSGNACGLIEWLITTARVCDTAKRLAYVADAVRFAHSLAGSATTETR